MTNAVAGDPMELTLAAVDSGEVITEIEGFVGTNSLGVNTGGSFSFAFTSATNDLVHFHAHARTVSGDELDLFDVPITFRPVNDDFAKALPIADGVAQTYWYSTAFATREFGELPHFISTNGPGTVWWKWAPKRETVATFDSYAGDLQIFKGTDFASLTAVAAVPASTLVIRPWGAFITPPTVITNEASSGRR